MKTIRVKSLNELRRKLRASLRDKERRVERAAKRAARRHRAYIIANMPVASSELRASVHVVGTRVVVDAPHAAAVERGSRPHWMPLEPLIKWVKLRGFQGLASTKSLSRMPGTSTRGHAESVASQFASHRRGGEIGAETGFTDLGAVRDIAKGIQLAIALKGTKPTWFMRDSLPKARGFLAEEISKELSRDD